MMYSLIFESKELILNIYSVPLMNTNPHLMSLCTNYEKKNENKNVSIIH